MSAPTQAIERLQKKLEKEPNSLVFLQLADEYRKEGLLNEALLVCQEGLRRHSNYWSARVALGRIQYEMGDLEAAGGELEKVIRSVPDNLLANRLLGEIYVRTNRPVEALKRYRTVSMITPADREVQAQIARLESRTPRMETREDAAPTLLIPALKDRMTFPELEPGPMGELEKEQLQPPEEFTPGPPAIEDMPAETDFAARVEPVESARGDTFRVEEQTLDKTDTVEPAAPKTVVMEDLADAAVVAVPAPITEIESIPPEEKPVEITEPVQDSIAAEEMIPEEFPGAVELMEPGDAAQAEGSGDSEASKSDELARIASIFLEDQAPSVDLEKDLPAPAPDRKEGVDIQDDGMMQSMESIEDFSTVDAELGDGELEQVIEETRPPSARRDSTQPIMEKEEDDTAPDAEELTPESLAEIYAEQGHIDRAIKIYQKILFNDPGNEKIQSKLQTLNPVDALIASASHAELQPAPAAALPGKAEQPAQHSLEQLNEERRRKINTLENWLASIRREG